MSSEHVSSDFSRACVDVDSSQEGQIPVLDFCNMTFLRHIKCGGMARISLYEVNATGDSGLPRHVAKKSLFNGSLSARFEVQLRSEMAILSHLKHENIVKTFGVVETDHDFGLVMEYFEFGSYKNFFETLWDNVMRTMDSERQTLPLKIRILDEITSAMKYLHGFRPKKVLHLDLKSENVLLDGLLHAKVCDFGLSRMTTLTSLRNSTAVEGVAGERPSGTPGHIAPERLRNAREKPTAKADVYSFGILEWEILTHKVPYVEIGRIDLSVQNQIADNGLRPLESDIPQIYRERIPELVDMMKKCWSGDPSERPSFGTLHSDLKTLEGRMSEFDKQAKASAQRTLDLYKTSYRSRSTNASKSEPQNRYMGVIRGSSLQHGPPPRQVSSMPANTVRKEIYHSSETPGQSEPTEVFIEKPTAEIPFHRENDPLLPKPVVEKKIGTPRKMLFIILGTIVVIGVAAAATLTSLLGNSVKGCPNLLPPPHGAMKCTSDESDVSQSCTFTCSDGYLPKGPDKLTCVGGKWNDKPPICFPSCSQLEPVAFAHFTCSDGRFQNSSCNFTCADNHQIQGFSTLTCESGGRWSHPEPSCVCQKCFIGDKCQYSIDWHGVANVLDQIQAESALTVHYGGEIFTCIVNVHEVLPKFTWSGKCVDQKTATPTKCSKYKSTSGAAKHAAAQLIRDLAGQKKYPEPCDPGDMDVGC